MSIDMNPIKNGSVVVIIGGGPAGSSCALKLKKLALQKKISPRIIVYEGKRFEKKSYYNQCLGVVSPPLDQILETQLGIPFPWDIIQKEIKGYYIHSENVCLKLAGEDDPSYACRRVEIDNYLFQKVKELDIETIPARVMELDFGPDGVMVFSESNNIKADVVVGAFGLDDGTAKAFERNTPYRQPKFLSSIVTKIHPEDEVMTQFGHYLHAFLPSSLPAIEFGAVTPKGNHLTCNIAGQKVDARMMDKFLDLPMVREVLPDDVNEILPRLYYFKGRFPTLPAQGIFGDRYVMIGDTAGLNRPFKGKGINSAVITGIKAAETMMNNGISKSSFRDYMRSCCELTEDIPYGKALRFFTLWLKKLSLLDRVLKAAEHSPPLQRALFNIVSGHETYKKTCRESGGFKFYFKLFLKALFKR